MWKQSPYRHQGWSQGWSQVVQRWPLHQRTAALRHSLVFFWTHEVQTSDWTSWPALDSDHSDWITCVQDINAFIPDVDLEVGSHGFFFNNYFSLNSLFLLQQSSEGPDGPEGSSLLDSMIKKPSCHFLEHCFFWTHMELFHHVIYCIHAVKLKKKKMRYLAPIWNEDIFSFLIYVFIFQADYIAISSRSAIAWFGWKMVRPY